MTVASVLTRTTTSVIGVDFGACSLRAVQLARRDERWHIHHWVNIENEPSLPDEPFAVFEKYDGSLLIVARFEDDVVVATRGAFCSPQAQEGAQILAQYGYDFIQPGWTYLFEVIYPENRIVVDYGDERDIVFLSAVHTETGEEHLPPLPEIPTPQAKVYHIRTLEQLKEAEEENREGKNEEPEHQA